MCFWVPEVLGIRTTELPTLSDLLYSGDAVCIGRLIVVRSTTCVLGSWSPGDQTYRVIYPERSPIFRRCSMYWSVDCSQIYYMCFWVPEVLEIRPTELPTLSDLLYSGDAVCIGRLIVVRSTTCVSGFLKSWGSDSKSNSYFPILSLKSNEWSVRSTLLYMP